MADFECTCVVVKGERELAWGEDCYSWYPKPNYDERLYRCRDCRWSTGCASDCHDFALYRDPNGFCYWAEPKD